MGAGLPMALVTSATAEARSSCPHTVAGADANHRMAQLLALARGDDRRALEDICRELHPTGGTKARFTAKEMSCASVLRSEPHDPMRYL